MIDALNVEELIALHKKLNDFAKHHNKQGVQHSLSLVEESWKQMRKYDNSKVDAEYLKGFSEAFRDIIQLLTKESEK